MTQFDYIVVGAGPAGCVLAARLSEDPGVRVALLDAGAPDTRAWADCPASTPLLARSGGWFSELQPGLNGRSAYLPLAHSPGGASAIGDMVYSRGHPADYDRWAADNPGWAYADLKPYFGLVEATLAVVDLPLPSASSQAFVAAAGQAGWPHGQHYCSPVCEGIGLHQVMQRQGRRVTAASAYLEPQLLRPNLQLLAGALCTRILLRGTRAIGVEYLQDGRSQQLATGGEVLLCAGALQSPQLLMLSGIGPHAHLIDNSIATRHDLPGVGQNLQDQVAVAQVFQTARAPDLLGLSLPGLRRAWQGWRAWKKTGTGPLTSNWWEAGGCVQSQADADGPDVQLAFAIGPLLQHGRQPVWGRGFTLQTRVLRPQSRGHLQLHSKDPMVAPFIDLNLLGHREDMECLQRGVRLQRGIVQQPALAAFSPRETRRSAAAQSDLQLEHFIRDHAQACGHWAGSCQMGPGGEDTLDVVDSHLRVHGLQGLRVVDASVLPGSMGSGTQAAVMAVAERAAVLLRADSTSA